MSDSTSGFALAAILGGVVFLYAGIRGVSVLKSLQSVIQGKSPSTVAQTQPITATTAALATSTAAATDTGGTGNAEAGTGSNQAILQATAAEFGWTGAQWTALVNVENAEAGFSTTAKNPTSGALGMAQALGHGTSATAGTLGNEYGGFGLSTAQAKAANSGDAHAQALWMCNYIADTYGNPENAWAHEQADHWY